MKSFGDSDAEPVFATARAMPVPLWVVMRFASTWALANAKSEALVPLIAPTMIPAPEPEPDTEIVLFNAVS